MTKRTGHPTIKGLPEELRPRERLIKKGADSLSEIELLAILLGTGTQRVSAVELSSQLMGHYKTLRSLMDATVEELIEFDGVGTAKACQIKAALEFAKRLRGFTGDVRLTIKSPRDAAELFIEKLRYEDRECFVALLLNTKNQVIAMEDVSKGTLNSSAVHPRELFRRAIKKSAAAIILAHNHPSGDAKPSKDDLEVTKRLCEAGRIIGISVLDHIVTGDKDYTSMKTAGLM